MPDNETPEPVKAAAPGLVRPDKPTNKPQFGPGSKVNWDNLEADPNKRHHIGVDPTGRVNLKESGQK
jgi:hypothetical protein